MKMSFRVDLIKYAFLLHRFIVLQIYYRDCNNFISEELNTYVDFICVKFVEFNVKVSHRLHVCNS
jgi:hypothetical protein